MHVPNRSTNAQRATQLIQKVHCRFGDHRAWRVDLVPPRGVLSDGRTCSLRSARAGTPKPCSLRFAALRAAGLPGTGGLRVGVFTRGLVQRHRDAIVPSRLLTAVHVAQAAP